MTPHDDLDRLSSQELHDLAVSRAKRHLDVRFFWDLMRLLPAVEAAAGELGEAETDVMRLSAHVDDVAEAGRGEVAELPLLPRLPEPPRCHGAMSLARTAATGRAAAEKRQAVVRAR